MTTMLRRFVVAPSGFKESLSAELVADAIAAGVRRVVPAAVVRTLPLVDGGEGSAATLAAATHGHLVPVTVTGPVGDPVPAHIAVLGGAGPRTAVVEMAAAAGLRLVPRALRNPGATTSYGVCQLIMAAVEAGAERILVGCGDSGTCDGGAGALQALGARVRTALGDDVGYGGAALAEVDSLDLTGLDPRLRDVEVLVAVNPHNVLCGARGVARVFGPQKGATPEQVDTLSTAMEQWAKVLERDTGLDLRTVPGSGASGGLGAGLAAGLTARLLPRFEVMFDHVALDAALVTADLVITAEARSTTKLPAARSRPKSPAGPSATTSPSSPWPAPSAPPPASITTLASTPTPASCPAPSTSNTPFCTAPSTSPTPPNASCASSWSAPLSPAPWSRADLRRATRHV